MSRPANGKSSSCPRLIDPPQSAGFFSLGQRRNYAVINGKNRDLDAADVLFHEYVHYVLRNENALAYPAWYDEGLAEFLSTVRVREDRVEMGLHAAIDEAQRAIDELAVGRKILTRRSRMASFLLSPREGRFVAKLATSPSPC